MRKQIRLRLNKVLTLLFVAGLLVGSVTEGRSGGEASLKASEPPRTAAPGAARDSSGHSPADGRLAHGLGFAVLRYLAEDGRNEQVLISPHGVVSALLLAWNGADGETREAMARVLGLPPGAEFDRVNQAWAALDRSLLISDSQVDLAVANSLWVREGAELLSSFVERGRSSFGAELRNLDFGAAEAPAIINRWVESSTGGKIVSLVPDPIPTQVVVYVLNALYFKGEWSKKFDAAQTRVRDFHPDTGEPRQVPMMERSGSWPYLRQRQLEAVRLPYGEGRFSMYLVLPAVGELDAWLRGLDPRTWRSLVSSMEESEGRVILPRFSFGFATKLRPILSYLGMGVAFSSDADFSALTARPVAISEVLHKTFIEVDEEGSEAAAATAVEIADVAVGPPPFEFLANRPFFFAVSDEESGSLLFIGLIRSLPKS